MPSLLSRALANNERYGLEPPTDLAQPVRSNTSAAVAFIGWSRHWRWNHQARNSSVCMECIVTGGRARPFFDLANLQGSRYRCRQETMVSLMAAWRSSA